MLGPSLQIKQHWKALAVFALLNGLASIPVVSLMLKEVNADSIPLIYALGVVGLLLGILGLILPFTLLAAWFGAAVLLWQGKRVGVRLLRLLSGLHLVVCSILLCRMLVNWDRFMRATARQAR